MIQNVYNTQGKGSVTFSIPSSFPFRYVLIPPAESTKCRYILIGAMPSTFVVLWSYAADAV